MRQDGDGPGPLFDWHKLTRSQDPGTSKNAAASSERLIGLHERAIVCALEAMPGGGTKDEIAEQASLDPVAVARRMRKLADEGRVFETGRTRPTPAGRPATVWSCAPATTARPKDALFGGPRPDDPG